MRGIIFREDEVKATLSGRKTVMWRPILPQPEMALAYIWGGHKNGYWSYSPFDKEEYKKHRDDPKYWKAPCKGDEPLFVKETWRIHSGSRFNKTVKIEYAAGGDLKKVVFKTLEEYDAFYEKWNSEGYRSAVHLPEEAARIFIVVRTVECKRVKEAFDDPTGPNNIIVRSGFRYGCDFNAAWMNALKKNQREELDVFANPFAWVITYNSWTSQKEEDHGQEKKEV